MARNKLIICSYSENTYPWWPWQLPCRSSSSCQWPDQGFGSNRPREWRWRARWPRRVGESTRPRSNPIATSPTPETELRRLLPQLLCARMRSTQSLYVHHIFDAELNFIFCSFRRKKKIANQMLKVVWIVVWGGGLDGEFLFRAKKSKWITYEWLG